MILRRPAATSGRCAEGHQRRPADLVRLAVGICVLVLTSRLVRPAGVDRLEAKLFRAVNDVVLPGWTWPGIWLVMQLGVIGAVPLVAFLALATRRLRLGLDAVLAAGSIYVIAKVVKAFVERGRPDALLPGVQVLGEPAGGLGYVSGHSAVSVALAAVAAPYLPRRVRWVAWALAAAVSLARVYVGAHLPYDVIGGAALGIAAAALVHLVLGAPVTGAGPGARRPGS